MHNWTPPTITSGSRCEFTVWTCSRCGWKLHVKGYLTSPSVDELILVPGTCLTLTCEEAQVYDVQDT